MFVGKVEKDVFILNLDQTKCRRDIDNFFIFLDETLIRSPYFILMEGVGLGTFSQEDRIRLTTWFHQNKSHLKEYCWGVLRILEDQLMRERLSKPSLVKAYPCAYHVVENWTQAQNKMIILREKKVIPRAL